MVPVHVLIEFGGPQNSVFQLRSQQFRTAPKTTAGPATGAAGTGAGAAGGATATGTGAAGATATGTGAGAD